ncbi:acetylserotonin O-methyltransferase [Sphingomonas radiodurans]|uniref:acetylserotonin O-methyltransferase n=1 Tax=Sphingomonas radiodurans TaxID=2890321 RepID=UPI001E2ABF4B|nr:acetylserotonin O-methyltransferase [Sphingomonas radiodurans]WBH15569.1 methyltransferase [Sphingomonas radiodurans]
MLASPRFHKWVTRFPLTRPLARRRAGALFDLVAGFTYSQILAACIDSGLFDVLAEGPQDTAAIAKRIDLPVAGAERLLRGAAALDLVEAVGEHWMLGSGGASLRGNRGIGEMVAHHRLLYADLADPLALLRRGGGGGALSGLWHYAEASGTGDATAVAAYSALMAASQPMVATQAIDAYPFDKHRKLLDVGGGEGAFLTAVGARVPKLELGLFDLPAVAERARTRFDSAGLGERTTAHGGDFLRDSLPRGYDIISLIRVLHDHDDGPAMALLRNIHTALPHGGTLFIAEPMAQTPGAESVGDAYFGFYLLAMGSGRPRSREEISAMLREAGFSRPRHLHTAMPLTASAIVASRT